MEANITHLDGIGLHSLPDEILTMIVEYLNINDYISLVIACKYYNNLLGAVSRQY
jgi:hypothetical protein